MKKIVSITLVLLFVLSCKQQEHAIEKTQNKRDNIISVKDLIKEIDPDSILFSSMSKPYIIDDYLLIADYKSYDHTVQIFDKNDFHHIMGIAYTGLGPGEIARLGYVGIDEKHRKIELTDLGKQIIYSFDLDSVLADPFYMPQVKAKIIGEKLLYKYQYINENTCMGLILEPVSNSDYKVTVGTRNMDNGELRKMPYTHPAVQNKRVEFSVSPEYNQYVECYINQDLMSICSLDGSLKYNIYGGNDWKENERGRKEYYRSVAFVGDKIFALYLNDDGLINDPMKGPIGNYATKFLVFDLEGNYLATLETGYSIFVFCYDKDNNRIIFSFNEDMQFGYLDLNNLSFS